MSGIFLKPEYQTRVLEVQIKQLKANIEKAEKAGDKQEVAELQKLLDDSVAKKEELEKQIAENPQNMDLDFLRDEA